MKKLLPLIIVVALMLGALSGMTVAQQMQHRYVFVTHDLGAGIFGPVRSGMEAACAQVGAICEFIGPQTYDPAAQVALIEAAIATNPTGIATTRPEPGVYDGVLKQAVDAGILVVTFNTNDPNADSSLPLPFVGQNFTNYGVEWARAAMAALPDGGKIAISNCCLGHYALEERIRSFRETMAAEGGGKYEVLPDVINIGTDETVAYGTIEAFYSANPDVAMITGADYYTYVTAQFINNSGLQGKLLTGGSDMAPAMIDGLKAGYVAFALGQNPYLQGYYPVLMMEMAATLGIRPITIDTGTDVVTPLNVEEFNPEYR
jgi:ABC-type sugar transport system substrate-binding protein